MTEEEIRQINIEFSSEFDVLYNNITSNQAPGLDEYEKSLFLTRAQDEVLKSYFNPKTNKVQEGFDGSEQRQIDFSRVLVSKSYQDTEDSGNPFIAPSFDTRGSTKAVELEDDILMIVNEYVEINRCPCKDVTRLTVIPISYEEYTRLTSKPFKWPLKNQAWRLLDTSNGIRKAELIIGPNSRLHKYVIRYIKRPRPIILEDLEGITIQGESIAQCCELDPILYPDIIQRACELAKATYVGDLPTQIALGTTSQTNIGMVAQSK